MGNNSVKHYMVQLPRQDQAGQSGRTVEIEQEWLDVMHELIEDGMTKEMFQRFILDFKKNK